ncbi:MAG: DUF4394 domain-containing protein [Alkalinema sp. RU_4_3]|nr:DUF4394 domain-containing protein [Alkalinema sp. RU_4_3]
MIDDLIESDTIFGVVSDDIGIGGEDFVFSVDNNGTLVLAETVISTDPNPIAIIPPEPIAPPPVIAPPVITPPVITPPPIVDMAPPVTPPPVANMINGTDGDDQIFTQGTDDIINAKAGNDVIDSGGGNDVVVAGLGDDRIFSRDGNDTLQGGGGDDFLLAGNGDDILDGSIGNDFLLGEDGNDNLRGGAGNDILHGQNGNDAILGEGGNDIIFGGEGNDSIEGDGFLTFFGLGNNNTLVALDPANLSEPQTLQITGLPSGVSLVGIDRRPADNLLYSLGSDNRIYTLDFYTGAATFVSTLNTPFFNAGDSLAGIGFDFNPVPDRLRLVGSNDRNFRINVDTGAVADSNADQAGIQPDGTLAYVAGDINLGANPNVVAVAYSNNIAGATTTTLFGIDADRNTLLSFVAPNAGTLKTIGSLGFDVGINASFDILTSLTGDTNVGVLVDGNTAYQIDLTTGAATRLGSLGTQPLNGFAIALVPDLTASGDDQLFGGNGNDVISGNFGNDTIYGEGGVDRIFGGAGDDLLFGGDGADLFGFQSKRAFRAGDFGVDVIGDFRINEDRIVLGAASFGKLTAESFDFVANDQVAAGSTRSIVYSQSSGSLFFNADGATAGFGSGGKFAQILGAPTLTASQFVI